MAPKLYGFSGFAFRSLLQLPLCLQPRFADFFSSTAGNPRTAACRIVAEYEGVSLDYAEVDVASKPKEFTDAFPTGLVSFWPSKIRLMQDPADGLFNAMLIPDARSR